MATADGAKATRDAQFEAEALAVLPQVARYALSLTRNEADADDLVQETYLRAYRAWESFTPGTEIRAWLFTICRNLFYKSRVRAAREPSYDDPEGEAHAAAALRAAALERGLGGLYDRVDLRDALADAIAALPDVFRDAVVLVDVNDHTYESAAEALGVPVGTVRSRLFRGRRLLQESLLTHARDAGLLPAADPPPAGSHNT